MDFLINRSMLSEMPHTVQLAGAGDGRAGTSKRLEHFLWVNDHPAVGDRLEYKVTAWRGSEKVMTFKTNSLDEAINHYNSVEPL